MKTAPLALATITVFFMTLCVNSGLASDRITRLASKTDDENVMTLNSGIPVINMPTEIAESRPTPETFNTLYNIFFEGDYVEITEDNGLARLVEHFQHETSNGLFAKLKKREKDFHGGILLNPVQSADEQTILVFARVLYEEKGTHALFSKKNKTFLRSEALFIRFTPKGIFKSVERGIGTRQEMVAP